MAHTGSGTIQRARHALTFDNLVGYIGPILLAVILTVWRVWRHISGQKEREEREAWQERVCTRVEEIASEIDEMKTGQVETDKKVDIIGRDVQEMKGRFKQMDSQS